MKTLIVYYSWSGNTRRIARIIHKLVSGDIVELEPVNPYPQSYNATVEQAKREIQSGYKPPLKTEIDNIEHYEIIFIGSPNWWGSLAPPVASFLSQYDLSGKTIIPFCTHGGGGKQKVIEGMKALCPNSKILPEFVVYGSGENNLEDKVSEWLRQFWNKVSEK
ncbi:MAG: flavodoxin [Thermoproteota archaeon]